MLCRRLPLISVLSLSFLVGCGGGSSPAPLQANSVRIAINPSTITVPAGGSQLFVATVSGNSNHLVTWEVNGVAGGDATNGMITTGGFYTAPATIPTPATITVTARSQADTTKTASASASIGVGLSPISATVLIRGGTQQFTATGTSGAVTWGLSCVSPCDPSTIGTISSSGLYTAPDAIPDNVLTDLSLRNSNLGIIALPISVTAAPQSDPTDLVTADVYVNAGGPLGNQISQGAPVKLGTTGGNINDQSGNGCCSGTLGSLVVRNTTNYILSNNHVLARSGSGQNGEAIGQPGLVDANCNPGMTVATLSQQVTLHRGGTSTADAAIAQITTGEVDTSGAILQLGTVSGGLAQAAPAASTVSVPTSGMLVAKSGRTTGLSCSTIAATNIAVSVTYDNSCGSTQTFTVDYDNQVDIISTSFGAPGDSGSLIVDAQTAEPVALLYAGSETDTVANPIQAVLAALPDTANPPHFPTFVGTSTHPVEGCTGNPGPRANSKALRGPTQEAMDQAIAAKEKHLAALRSDPAVLGVGVTAGDTPGAAAVVIFVEKGKTPASLPAELDGVPTKVRVVKPFKALDGACPSPNATSMRLRSLR